MENRTYADLISESAHVLLVNAGVEVDYKQIELFAKGENLLNRKYEINLGFPMPGTTVMGSVNINF